MSNKDYREVLEYIAENPGKDAELLREVGIDLYCSDDKMKSIIAIIITLCERVRELENQIKEQR